MTKPIPDGYHAITPYLIVAGGAKALEFYRRAFGAIERERMQDPSGKIRHAEISIGDSRVMLADEHPEIGALGPATIGGSPVSIHLYVEDVDAGVDGRGDVRVGLPVVGDCVAIGAPYEVGDGEAAGAQAGGRG